MFDVEEIMSNLHIIVDKIRAGEVADPNAAKYCKIIASLVPKHMIRKSKNLTGFELDPKYKKLDLDTFELLHYEIKLHTNNYERAVG